MNSRAQISVGACASFGKVASAIQKSDHGRSLEGTPSGNSSRDGNGALDLCHLSIGFQANPLANIELRYKAERNILEDVGPTMIARGFAHELSGATDNFIEVLEY